MKGGYVCSNFQPISVTVNDSNKQILNVMFKYEPKWNAIHYLDIPK
jgi:uncharacterized Fe-S radical SAM superfamily protein PflX